VYFVFSGFDEEFFFIVFVFFLSLICFGFGFFGLFLNQTRVFCSVYGQIKDFGSTWSGQSDKALLSLQSFC
jgi:hypothetical protein